jgi:hypothetical protein
MPYQTTTSPDEPESIVYVAKEFGNDQKCAHHFKRVNPYRVECQKCHCGWQDSPDSPFPIEDLNMYYELDRVKQYNKSL